MKSKVKIKAEVEVTIEHDADEDVTARMVDIYLHGAGETGHINKEDVGASNWRIEVLETEKTLDNQETTV